MIYYYRLIIRSNLYLKINNLIYYIKHRLKNTIRLILRYLTTRITRSTLLFEQSIKSKYTKINYKAHLDGFKRFAGINTNDELAQMPQMRLQRLLEDYLIELRRTTNPNTIPSRFQGIRHFCIMNRQNPNWDVIRRMFPQKQKTPNLRPYTTDDVRGMLRIAGVRDKALVHFMASTGARIGVFDHVMSRTHLRKMPGSCSAIRLYAGEVEEYWGFLTPQATRALAAYHRRREDTGEELTSDSPIFTASGTSRQLGWSGARSAIYRLVTKSDITRSRQGGRYDVQIDHGFRKRFNTVLKLDNSMNYNVAEKLMGHKNGLDGTYFVPTIEEMFAEFQKVVPALKI